MNLPTYSTWVSDPSEEVKNWGFRINDGEYESVTVKINDVTMSEDDQVSVDFDAISANESHPKDFSTSDSFHEVFSLIFNKILKDAIELDESHRANNP
jgi:hypothetical protein